MPSIRYLQFGGLRPAVSSKSLPLPYAVQAHNAELRNGELCPFLAPRDRGACTSSNVHLLPALGELACWDACIVPYYDICGGEPAVALFPPGVAPLRLLPGGSAVPLVPPAPVIPPALTQISAGVVTHRNSPEDRAYVYTWVNRFGYESQPSPPAAAPLAAYDAVYSLALEVPPPEVVCVRVYRVVRTDANSLAEKQTVTTFQLVREIDPAAVFIDDVIQRDMEFGEMLSLDACPPVPMDCVMELEAGYLVGFTGRTVRFSERGEPHNWPERYVFTLPWPVVGMAVHGDTVFVGTTGRPHALTLTPPSGDIDAAAIRVTDFKVNAPLKHRLAITTTDTGAAMASTGGMWYLGPNGARLVTRQRVDERVWDEQWDPHLVVWHQGRLFGSSAQMGGFIMGWQTAEELDIGDLVTIDWDPVFAHAGANGRLYYIEGGRLWEWAGGADPMTYVWRSGTTRTPGEMHWAAMKLEGDFSGGRTVRVRILNLRDGVYHDEVRTEPGIFRVACHPRGVQWALELTGTACICEAHLATSKTELVEQGTGGNNAA